MVQKFLLLAMATATCAISAALQPVVPQAQGIVNEFISHIDAANAQAFKRLAHVVARQDTRTYYYIPSTTTQDVTKCITVLLEHAQNKRNALIQKRESLQKNSRHYPSLCTATAQFYGALCSLCSIGISISVFAAEILNSRVTSADAKKKHSDALTSFRDKIIDFNVALKKRHYNPILIPALLIPRCFQGISVYPMNFDNHPKKTTGWFLLAFGLSTYLTYWFTTAAIKNMKIGWNYKEYVEAQIKNLDEIIEFLHTQADAQEPAI